MASLYIRKNARFNGEAKLGIIVLLVLIFFGVLALVVVLKAPAKAEAAGSCIALNGFSCTNAQLFSNGTLAFSLMQKPGSEYGNAYAYFVPMHSNFSTPAAYAYIGTMQPGQEANVSIRLPEGAPYPSSYAPNASVQGYIYLDYINGNGGRNYVPIGIINAAAEASAKNAAQNMPVLFRPEVTTSTTSSSTTTTIVYMMKYCNSTNLAAPSCAINAPIFEAGRYNIFWVASSAAYSTATKGLISANWPIFTNDLRNTSIISNGTSISYGMYYNGGIKSSLAGIDVYSKEGWDGFLEYSNAAYWNESSGQTIPNYTYAFTNWQNGTKIAVLLLVAWGAMPYYNIQLPSNCTVAYKGMTTGKSSGIIIAKCNQFAGYAYNVSAVFPFPASFAYAAIAFPYGSWG